MSWLRKLFASRPSPRTLHEGWFERWMSETRFLARYPAFAGILARLRPVSTNTVASMAVGLWRWDDPASRPQLLVNLDYFETYPEFRAGILIHEIHHVELGHLTDPKFHAVRYPRLMELAMEVSANESIREPLPAGTLLPKTFASYGVGAGQSTMERYRLLADAYDAGRLRIQDWWFRKMFDTHRPRQRGGRASGVGDLIDARSDGASERNWNRDEGRLGPRTNPVELELMKEAIALHLRGDRGGDDDPRLDGTQRRVAKELRRLVTGEGSSSMNWRRVLDEALPRRRRIRPTYLRPNRRFPERVGVIPGRIRRPPKPTLWVGVDTSGSMTGASLDRVAREIERLAAHARLTIVECDAAVHRVYAMPDRLGPFVGGGDTDFGPVFDELRGNTEIEGVVYFTDGKGDLPSLPPSLPTVWALTHDGPFHTDFGLILRLGDLD